MRVTGIEVDGEKYKVVKAENGDTYCEECDLNDMCTKKDNQVYPCNMVGDEEIFKKNETNI